MGGVFALKVNSTALGDSTDGQPGVARGAQLPCQDNVQLRVELPGTRVRDDDAAARNAEDQRVVRRVSQPAPAQQPGSLPTIRIRSSFEQDHRDSASATAFLCL